MSVFTRGLAVENLGSGQVGLHRDTSAIILAETETRPFNIVLVGKNRIAIRGTTALPLQPDKPAISVNSNVNISGEGSLEVNASTGIRMRSPTNCTLTITDAEVHFTNKEYPANLTSVVAYSGDAISKDVTNIYLKGSAALKASIVTTGNYNVSLLNGEEAFITLADTSTLDLWTSAGKTFHWIGKLTIVPQNGKKVYYSSAADGVIPDVGSCTEFPALGGPCVVTRSSPDPATTGATYLGVK